MQGRDMEQIFVGIDVSKTRWDVDVRPQGETFAVAADETGMQELVTRVRGLARPAWWCWRPRAGTKCR